MKVHRAVAACFYVGWCLLGVSGMAEETPAKEEPTKETPAKPEPSASPKGFDPRVVRRLIEVKHPETITTLRKSDVLLDFPVRVRSDNNSRLVILSGDPAVVEAAEAVIRRIDVPPKGPASIEFVAHLVRAYKGEARAQAVPDGLRPVLDQLKAVLAYPNYELQESLILRATDERGNANVSGAFPSGFRTFQTIYALSLRQVQTVEAEGAGRVVRVGELNLRLEVPVPYGVAGAKSADDEKTPPSHQYRNLGIKTSLEIREGQKVVVGKAALDGANEGLILVITADVL
jgi:hypothetical protein